ncbi:MAG TPA: hypothetical protein VGL91_05975 [Acidobacteriota bacterium]|jgi:hypothetical protein
MPVLRKINGNSGIVIVFVNVDVTVIVDVHVVVGGFWITVGERLRSLR